MENKKYQVFISSTYKDLIEERRKILDILLSADCIPAGMEVFVATDAEQFEVIKRVIDLCDYYVLIIGRRYGSISPNTGISYTEMEYDYAISKKIPVLVFGIDESVELPPEKVDSGVEEVEKLKAFRGKAMNTRLSTVWHTTDDLIGKLAISIMKAKSDFERPGWQRGVDFDEASLRREIMNLQVENEKLKKSNEEKQKIIDKFNEQTDLAFEDCEITFGYHYYSGKDKINRQKVLRLTEIFKVIGLLLLDVSATEYAIERAIISKMFNEYNVTINFNDSQIVKMVLNQLKSLNLITSEWNGTALYWRLTEKGKKVRDDMVLIRNK